VLRSFEQTRYVQEFSAVAHFSMVELLDSEQARRWSKVREEVSPPKSSGPARVEGDGDSSYDPAERWSKVLEAVSPPKRMTSSHLTAGDCAADLGWDPGGRARAG